VRAGAILLLIAPPFLGATLAGVLVGIARKLAREPQAPVTDFIVLGSIAAISAALLALCLFRAARARLRAAPWTAAGGAILGLIAAGAHALLK
jgi:hypothetical protein